MRHCQEMSIYLTRAVIPIANEFRLTITYRMTESIKSWVEVERLARNKKRILVVDDQEALADLVDFMLTSEGYFVEKATDGDVAFNIYCQYLSEKLPFDFVLTGFEQPGLNGIELMHAILKKKPDQRFGFSTAYPVLPRPFEKDQLLAFVRRK
jgi:CheY-like chemotaxis protein